MSIVLINDLTRSQYPGGTERSLDVLVKQAPFETQIITTEKACPQGADLFVINNARTFSDDFLLSLIDKPHIMWEHDILDTGRTGLKKKLMDTALANIFLSPGHLEKFEALLGFPVPRTELIPSLLDLSLLTRQTKRIYREPCYVGAIFDFKGIEDILLWARANKTVCYFFGWGDDKIIDRIISSKYGEYCGIADDQKLAEVYSEFSLMIHIPVCYEACGRSVMEGYLSGLDIVHNDNVGFFSYDWDWEDLGAVRKKIQEAPGYLIHLLSQYAGELKATSNRV